MAPPDAVARPGASTSPEYDDRRRRSPAPASGVNDALVTVALVCARRVVRGTEKAYVVPGVALKVYDVAFAFESDTTTGAPPFAEYDTW